MNPQVMRTMIFCAGLFSLGTLLIAEKTDVVVHDVWVRLPMPAQNDAALYFVIENHGSAQRSIVSATSAAAEKVEIHQEMMDKPKKMMSMAPIQQIALPAGGKVVLQPGGLHVMLFGLKSRLAAGAMVPVTFKLDDGTVLNIMATVRAQLDSMKDSMKTGPRS
jgi:copper(I)-binding protein